MSELEQQSEDNVLAGRYRLLQILVQSNTGMQILADDLLLGKRVVIRSLPDAVLSSNRAVQLIQKATEDASKLFHENILRANSIEEGDDSVFIVTEVFEGIPLASWLDQRGSFTVNEVHQLFIPIAKALDYAHSRGIFNLNLSPSNIFVASDGSPKIVDFAIGSAICDALALVNAEVAPHIAYFSPEQLAGEKPSAEQDVYSMAAIAYECIAGHPPFYRGQLEYQIVNVPPVPLQEDNSFTRAILKALAKNPAHRLPSCIAVLDGISHNERLAHEVSVNTGKRDSSVLASFARSSGRTPPSAPPPHISPPNAPRTGSHSIPHAPRPMPSAAARARTNTSDLSSPNADPPKKTNNKNLPPQKRIVNSGDEWSLDLFYRLRTDPILRSIVFILTFLLIGYGVVYYVLKERDISTNSIFTSSGFYQPSVNSSNYKKFGDVEFGRTFDRFPQVGDDVGFGVVTAIGFGQRSFDVKLHKGFIKNFFPSARINLTGGGPTGNGGRINSIRLTKGHMETTPPDRAKLAVSKISSLIAKEFNIPVGETKSDLSNTHFSQYYNDGVIEIRVSCTISPKTTSFFVLINNQTFSKKEEKEE